MNQLEILQLKSQKDWKKWLDKNHTQADGVWLKFAKKNSGETTVSYGEAVETGLCYGWIDSQAKTLDGKFYLQRFTPRRAKSIWSKINREKIEKLIADGKMKPAGLAQVEAAKADGRGAAAYSSAATIEIPEDFQKAMERNKKAADFFAGLSSSNRYAILFRLENTKRAETRSANIQKYIQMLADGIKFHP
jgi:uncharacterized protein YdeI (YjbR/CyaY-like superfamily)